MSDSQISLVVQIEGKRHSYVERLGLDSNGLILGRAWDSDILIQDKYVDAKHLKLSLHEEHGVTIQDLSSTNGSMLANKTVNGELQSYRWGEEIRVGDTRLRIFDQASAVEKTADRSHWYSLQKYLESKSALAIIALIAIVISTISEWAFSLQPVNSLDLIVHGVSVAVVLLVWTLVFGSIGKLVQGQSNMQAHLGLVSLVVIGIILIGTLLSILLFNLQSPKLAQWLTNGLYGMIFFIFCFALLTYTTHLGSRAKWISSVLLVGGTMIMASSDSFLKEPHELWDDRSHSELTTLPPALLFREPVTLEQYLADSEHLFSELSEQD